MVRLIGLILALLVAAAGPATRAFDWRLTPAVVTDDEQKPDYAPIVERKLDFWDFSYKTPEDGLLNFRQYVAGKPVVVVAYFAGWCPNSNRNGHVLERLWTKYRGRGLGVVAVAEYSDSDELRIHIGRIGVDYPVVIETKKRGDRKDSSHFKYRRAVGDKRKWGTPFYVLIDAQDVAVIAGKSPLARRVFTVSGEIIESEAERFIEQRLPPGAVK